MITPDWIIQTRQGASGVAGGVVSGNSIGPILFIHGVIGIASVAWGGWSLLSENLVAGVSTTLIGGLYLW